MAQLGTFDDLLELTPEALRPVAAALRDTVLRLHPEAVEVVRLGDKAATYGLGPRKMIDGYAYIMPHAKWVNLGFYKGADLNDPKDLLEGTGAKLRHIKMRSIDDTEREGVEDLILAALTERRKALETG